MKISAKNLLLTFCCCLQLQIAFAQEEPENEEGEFDWQSLIYENDGFSFNAAIYGMGAKTFNTNGIIPLQTRLGYGFYGNLNYWVNFNKTFGLELGFAAGVLPLNFRYEVPLDQNKSIILDDKTATTFGMFNVPVYWVTRVRVSQKTFGFLKSGINFRHAGFGVSKYDYGFVIISDTSRMALAGASFEIPESKFRINYGFKLGFEHILPNYDLLSTSIIYNYSPRVIINGTYQFYANNQGTANIDTKGIYQTKGSYIGIELGYSFTGAGKRLRQIKAIGRKARRERE